MPLPKNFGQGSQSEKRLGIPKLQLSPTNDTKDKKAFTPFDDDFLEEDLPNKKDNKEELEDIILDEPEEYEAFEEISTNEYIEYDDSSTENNEYNIESEKSSVYETPKNDPFEKFVSLEDDFEQQKEFIDNDNKKIKPFGEGSKNKKNKIKATDFDDRKNLQKKSKIVTYSVFGLISLLFLFGVYKLFFPPKDWSEDEISQVSLIANERYGYPLEAGGSFAKEFSKVYLTIDKSNKENDSLLSFFYTGQFNSQLPEAVMSTNFASQKIVTEPQIVEMIPIDIYSTRYVTATAITNKSVSEDDATSESDVKWIYLSINVYWDQDTGRFSIVSGSPTLVPSYEFASPSEVPPAAPIGDPADEQYISEVESIVYEFIKGFSSSSASNNQAIAQYILEEFPGAIMPGLAGEFTLSGPENESIKYSVFFGSGGDANELKVKASVLWRDSISNSEESIVYPSEYIMTLVKQGDRYLVSRFLPENYFMDTELAN